jgi:hypothetical protein
MKNRPFGHVLLGLALIGAMLAGAALAETEETTGALLGPADWARVDGQDHDLDEMLSLLRPLGAETLAIFAPKQSWKPFFDKIYGRNPIDLSLYATVYLLPLDQSNSPNLSDWPSFYQAPPAETSNQDQTDLPSPPAMEPLYLPASEAVTFRTTLTSAGETGDPEKDKAGKTTYTVIASIIFARGQVFSLNLLQADPADSAELEHLAWDWRTDFLEAQVRMEEAPSEQNLE